MGSAAELTGCVLDNLVEFEKGRCVIGEAGRAAVLRAGIRQKQVVPKGCTRIYTRQAPSALRIVGFHVVALDTSSRGEQIESASVKDRRIGQHFVLFNGGRGAAVGVDGAAEIVRLVLIECVGRDERIRAGRAGYGPAVPRCVGTELIALYRRRGSAAEQGAPVQSGIQGKGILRESGGGAVAIDAAAVHNGFIVVDVVEGDHRRGAFLAQDAPPAVTGEIVFHQVPHNRRARSIAAYDASPERGGSVLNGEPLQHRGRAFAVLEKNGGGGIASVDEGDRFSVGALHGNGLAAEIDAFEVCARHGENGLPGHRHVDAVLNGLIWLLLGALPGPRRIVDIHIDNVGLILHPVVVSHIHDAVIADRVGPRGPYDEGGRTRIPCVHAWIKDARLYGILFEAEVSGYTIQELRMGVDVAQTGPPP